MPKERIILLIILIVSLIGSAAFIAYQTGRPAVSFSETSEMEKMIADYQRIIREAESNILTDEQKAAYESEIARLENSYFPQDTGSSAFGSAVEKLIRKNNLRVKRVNDTANGFQFIAEGTVYGALAFLHDLEDYPYRITIPVCDLHYLTEGKWQLAIQCFPVYAKPVNIKEASRTHEEKDTP